jgi:tRNA pseudouridine38-40 synthase
VDQSGPELEISSMDGNPAEPHLRNWKLTLSYDGTEYHGWQVQPGLPTVQGELQAALGRVTGEAPLPQGSGRTDAGVHALGQVASFVLAAGIPEGNLMRALNRTLPAAIRILEARVIKAGFHARHSTVAKTYEYRVFLEQGPGTRGRGPGGRSDQGSGDEGRRICPPFLARYVYAYPWPLDLGELQRAAELFVGTHDFLSFAATDPDEATREEVRDEEGEPASAVRTIFRSWWERRETEEGSLLVYRVRGDGFLHHMVRNLVGTMLDVGRGYRRPEEIPGMIEARSRAAAGPTAPARGLFLHSVEYEEASGQ